MKKIASHHRPIPPAPPQAAAPVPPLQATVAAAAGRLLHLSAPRTADPVMGPPDDFAALGIPALKERCAAFGIAATDAELVLAGLYLLTQQTETALEVAMLQSLRADRSCTKRRSKRT